MKSHGSLPRLYFGVMVSSTFTDLERQREALIKAVHRQDLKAIAMENDSAKPDGDVIDSSLNMVRDSSAYIGIISHKYGQVPLCEIKNPENLSLTELEFREAQRLDRATLIFIMGDDHDVKRSDVEQDPEKMVKLAAFRERVKRAGATSEVQRVYKVFESFNEFEISAAQSLGLLQRHLETQVSSGVSKIAIRGADAEDNGIGRDAIPKPPSFYAEPPYIGSHAFVGRLQQMETLNDWASADDSHAILLFEAIGGSGKSILTWEWVMRCSQKIRSDWAGRCWYSFYERGATMADFCRRTLSYITGEPVDKLKDKNTAELAGSLIRHLRSNPWLVVLDGLERVLVSYHRLDAAQIPDEQAGESDAISDRNPCSAINPEDEDLLRALSAASPSKLLLTTRLVPRVLMNSSGQPIPGVLHERLPGLRPLDAELLIRSCGVAGDSQKIQSYLKNNCDCHPLVIGVLAGLITNYLPDKGNFDRWVEDEIGGGGLNLADLNLLGKRNHILSAAFAALPDNSRKILSILALLSGSVDYDTLAALDPSLPDTLEGTSTDDSNDELSGWGEGPNGTLSLNISSHVDIDRAKKVREVAIRDMAPQLADTIKDLEGRGLLQYDHGSRRYDLHPVVRGVAVGGLKNDEVSLYGQRVIDCFSQMARNPYELAENLGDFDNARLIVRSLFQMGRQIDAAIFIGENNFLSVLNSKFEAHNEILSILRPFFSEDWTVAPLVYGANGSISFASMASMSLRRIGALSESYRVSERAIFSLIESERYYSLCSQLINLSSTAGDQNCLRLEDRLINLALEGIRLKTYEKSSSVSVYLARFRQLAKLGRFDEAGKLWKYRLMKAVDDSAIAVASHHYALYLFLSGRMTEGDLVELESKVGDSSALGRRNMVCLRGYWYLEQGDWERAKASLQQAVSLANKAGKVDRRSEIRLAYVQANLGELVDPRQVAEQFSYSVSDQCLRGLAELWFVAGDVEKARCYGLKALLWARGEGDAYSQWYEKTKTIQLLNQLGVNASAIASAGEESPDSEIPLEGAIRAVFRKIRRVEAAASAEEPYWRKGK